MFQDVSRDELMTQKYENKKIVEAKNTILYEQETAINELQVELDTANSEKEEDDDYYCDNDDSSRSHYEVKITRSQLFIN